jgi:hypothetical protein
MADYVRFRWTTAKVGVSMALLALVAGAAERARAAAGHVKVTPALQFLKLTGLSKTISGDFLKVEAKLIKLNNAISSLDKKWVKIERNLSQNYLTTAKIQKAFLQTADANAKFLTISDAALKYLKADGTAVNAAKLGNLTPDAFFQGHGNVVSGALSSLSTQSQQLLSLPGGIIVVSIADVAGAGRIVTIHNGTSQTLAAVLDMGNQQGSSPLSLKPNGDTQLPAVQGNSADIRVQIFPGGTFTNVVSILIGLTPNPSTNQPEAVAQAFTGGV